MLYQLSYLAKAGQCSPVDLLLCPIAEGWLRQPGGMRGLLGRRPHGGARGGTMGSSAKDTTVFSRVLYQLSYLAKAGQCSRVSL